MVKKCCLLGLAVLLFGGCHTSYSARFEPSSPTGIVALANSKKNIYPKQVFENPDLYRNEFVAWAGIVKEINLFESRSGPAATILVEHHYFDWIEDHGGQREQFFLSPKGEGNFGIVLGPTEFDKDIKVRIPIGTMVVAIGKTKVMSDAARKQLYVLTEYRQFIDKKAYRMDVYDYGREGEPFKSGPGSSLPGKAQQ